MTVVPESNDRVRLEKTDESKHHRDLDQYPDNRCQNAGEDAPNNVMATATDNSKKLEAPIIPAGAAISWLKRSFLHAR
jgi:hypothetical protein